ncbi:MAG: T9SS type A sorting domain-containing protein [Flavobacteriales bacterium]|nr:T9SS type A sorting domain-containing protein [Flavobacteriales bacterium]
MLVQPAQRISIAATSEGDTLPGSRDEFLAKYSGNGDLVWVRQFEGYDRSAIQSLVLDSNAGHLYVIGNYDFFLLMDTCMLSTPWSAAFLSKWDLDGHCLWAHNIATSFAGTSAVVATAITVDGNGDLVVVMTTDNNGTTVAGGTPMETGCFLGKYDADGEEVWVKPFTGFNGINKWVRPYVLRYFNDRIFAHGDVFITAENDTTAIDTIQILGRQGHGQLIASIDPATGVAEWVKLDGFPDGWAGRYGMDLDGSGNIYSAGTYVDTAAFEIDTLIAPTIYGGGFLAKYGPDGTMEFIREYSGTNTFDFNAIDVSPTGAVLLTGSLQGQIALGGNTYTANTGLDAFSALSDSDGDIVELIHAGMGSGSSIAYDNGSVLVSGPFPPDVTPVPYSITIGSETYDSHGWMDIFLAKHDMLTGTPQSIMLENTSLEIYANPNNGNFRLKVPSALANDAQLQLRIYDGTGRMVSEQQLLMDEERPRLDVWDVSPGFYMVTLSNGKRTYSGNMVVE